MTSSTLKFGPEWLRNLSDGSVSSIPSASSSSSTSNSVASHGPSSQAACIGTAQKYKLADYRYGREEMLALFAAPIPVPENLKELKAILSDRLQQPLALQPETDDEQHLFSQPVNSTAVLRMTGRGSAAPLGGLRGDVDRGRGRGRGRSEVGGFYSRVPIEEDSFSRGSRLPRDANEADSRGRGFGYMGRSFDDMSTSSSSHGEFSRSMSTENWRMSRKYEDNEGSWRKPSQRSTSRRWREPWEKTSDGDRERMLDRRMSEDSYRDRSVPSYRRSISSNSAYDEEPDPLPEWSTDDVDDIGTFDSSGAFMSLKELEQQEKKERKSQEADNERDEEEADNLVSAVEQESTLMELEAESCASRADVAAPDAINKDALARQQQQQPLVEPSSSDDSCTQADDLPTASEVPKASGATDGAGQQPVNGAIASDEPTTEDCVTLAVEPESNGTCAAGEGQEAEVNFDHLELQVENLYASMSADEEPPSAKEKGFLLPDHEDAKKWFYRDPQGQVQGPFSSGEMAEWFSAGYFSRNLVVKQGADDCFVPLGELIKKMGSVPFIAAAPVKISPPLGNSQTDLQHHQDQLKLLLIQQQQQQQQQLQQQRLRTVQTQEAFAKLTPQQQQQLLLQVMLKQQLNPQVAAVPVSQQQQQKTNALNRSTLQDTMNAFQRLSSAVSSHPSANVPPSFHRSMSQPSGIDVSSLPSSFLYGLSTSSAAGTANNLPSVAMSTSGAAWHSSSCMPSASGPGWLSEAGTGASGLWNAELPKAITASALEEMQYLVLEKAHQQQRQQHQIPMPVAATALREPHQMKLQELLEARASAEKPRDANGAMGIDQLRELLQQQKQQLDIVRLAEEQRRLLEEKRRMLEMNPLDRQRLVRQDRSEELYRQQQQLDTLCRLQTDPVTSSLQDRDAVDVRQLLALQQTWASSQNRGQMVPSGAGLSATSAAALFHHKDNGASSSSSATAASIIQQELINKHLKLNDVKAAMNQWPVSSGASSSRWANEPSTWTGASLPPSKSSSLNWDNAAAVTANNKSINSFVPGGLSSQMKQEFVQKVHKSKEELTHWCENVLKGMLTCSSVDIPTFICHLMDLSSPAEVNQFVQAYLGDTDDAKKFVKQFVEKQNRIQQEALLMQYMSSGGGNPW